MIKSRDCIPNQHVEGYISCSIDWNFLSMELGFVFGLGIFIGSLIFLKQWSVSYWQLLDKNFKVPQRTKIHNFMVVVALVTNECAILPKQCIQFSLGCYLCLLLCDDICIGTLKRYFIKFKLNNVQWSCGETGDSVSLEIK